MCTEALLTDRISVLTSCASTAHLRGKKSPELFKQCSKNTFDFELDLKESSLNNLDKFDNLLFFIICFFVFV